MTEDVKVLINIFACAIVILFSSAINAANSDLFIIFSFDLFFLVFLLL